jgi:CRISPR-associated endonuclease Cas2
MYLILYDITETPIRTKVVRLLEKEGYERLQFSVFIAPFNPEKNKLWYKLQLLLAKTPNNKIYCLRITKENFYKIKIIGNFDLDLTYITGDKSSLII